MFSTSIPDDPLELQADISGALADYVASEGSNDPFIALARQHLLTLWSAVGEPAAGYSMPVSSLGASTNPIAVIRAFVADRMLLVRTFHGDQAAATVAIAEMRGLAREVDTVVVWTTLALMALACRGPRGLEVPGPTRLGHGRLIMERKVRQSELMLTFWVEGTQETNPHPAAHFVIDAADQWIVTSIDPALRLLQVAIPSIARQHLFAAMLSSPTGSQPKLLPFTAVGVGPAGKLFVLHLHSPGSKSATRHVAELARSNSFELFDGHLSGYGCVTPVVIPALPTAAAAPRLR